MRTSYRNLLALAAAMLVVLALGWKGCAMGVTTNAFDAQRWRAEYGQPIDRNGSRSGMLAALERDVLRKGMTRDEVRKLLGEPDAAAPSADEYALGRSQVGATLESYVIEYDASGRAVSFSLRRR